MANGKPLKVLRFRTSYALQYNNNFTKSYSDPVSYYNTRTNVSTYVINSGPGGISNNLRQGYNTLLEGRISYTKEIFKGQTLSLIAATSEEYWFFRNLGAYKYPRLFTTLSELDAALNNSESIVGNSSTEGLRSYIGHLNYNIKDKYLLEGNCRYDGSSKFVKGYRYGFFPSVALAWRISEEPFFSNFRRYVDNVKLRLSIGSLGNNSGVSRYAQKETLANTNYLNNKTLVTGYSAVKQIDRNFSWENTRVINVGLDLNFFKNKLTMTLDGYDRLTTGMIRPSTLSTLLSGYTPPNANIGIMRNDGVELNMNWQSGSHELKYRINFNVSYNLNRLEKWNEYLGRGSVYLNMPYHFTYVYKAEGIAQTVNDINNAAFQGNNTYEAPGDIVLADVNGDGQITDQDLIADPKKNLDNPLVNYGMTLSLTWKGFDANVLLQGTSGRWSLLQGWLSSTRINTIGRYPFNTSQLTDTWNPYNTDAPMPRLTDWNSTVSPYNDVASTYTLENMSYLRLKNIQLGYTVPSTVLKKFGVEMIRLFLSGDNVFTITKWKGVDPEKSAVTVIRSCEFHGDRYLPGHQDLFVGYKCKFLIFSKRNIMKSLLKYKIKFLLPAVLLTILSSCTKNLLEQVDPNELSSDVFWANTLDAFYATNAVYSSTRDLFQADYVFDSESELQISRGTQLIDYSQPGPTGGRHEDIWKKSYQVVNRANYVIENVKKMMKDESSPDSISILKRIEGENIFLRSLAYFRLIELWGDVPFFTTVLKSNAVAYSLSRTPLATIKDSLVAELTYAASVLPARVSTADKGRVTQAAAYAFLGKIWLYWASWNKYGWPELEGFNPSPTEAQNGYTQAAAAFHKVIYDYGLTIYGDGNPGTYQSPAYGQLFTPAHMFDPEILFALQFAGPGLGQGESMTYYLGNRQTCSGGVGDAPTYRLVDYYQLTSTGTNAPPLVLVQNDSLANGASNLASYQGRDWRMRSTIVWNGEKMAIVSPGGVKSDSIPYLFGEHNGIDYIDYNSNPSGYIYRKWVNQWGLNCSSGDGTMNFYLMRLADVYLMYCEAVNEVSGPGQELTGLVNKLRSRGNLPALGPDTYASKDAFFKAIEQERIVELAGEGHRPFDIRRWRQVEDIWGPPNGNGLTLYGAYGDRIRDEFKNASPLIYGQYYICRIPESERVQNPNLKQNLPWL